jgi:hypothetical protein
LKAIARLNWDWAEVEAGKAAGAGKGEGEVGAGVVVVLGVDQKVCPGGASVTEEAGWEAVG